MLLYLSLDVLSSVAKSFVSSTHGKGNELLLFVDRCTSFRTGILLFMRQHYICKITNNRSVIIIKIVTAYEISCITDSGKCKQYSRRNVRIFALITSETIRDIINLFLLTPDSIPYQ